MVSSSGVLRVSSKSNVNFFSYFNILFGGISRLTQNNAWNVFFLSVLYKSIAGQLPAPYCIYTSTESNCFAYQFYVLQRQSWNRGQALCWGAVGLSQRCAVGIYSLKVWRYLQSCKHQFYTTICPMCLYQYCCVYAKLPKVDDPLAVLHLGQMVCGGGICSGVQLPEETASPDTDSR